MTRLSHTSFLLLWRIDNLLVRKSCAASVPQGSRKIQDQDTNSSLPVKGLLTHGNRAVPADSVVSNCFQMVTSNFTPPYRKINISHDSSRLMISSARLFSSGVIKFIPEVTTLDLGMNCIRT